MFGVSISMDVHPEGQPERRHEHVASMDVIGDDYFRVMDIPRRAGRIFTAGDRDGAAGIRMALGAEFGDIARLIYRGVLLPSAIGLGIGGAAAIWLTRLLQSLLVGIKAGDLTTLVLTGFTLLAISVLAATGPAIRAALSDPSRALRRE